METETKMSRFAKYAWFVLAYNLLVILWGVVLRASHSGDGCGQHWLTCKGEIIPSAPELKTAIEFSHRITTVAAGFAVIGLLIWALREFERGSWVRTTAFFSFVFICIEGLIGMGLVLTGNTSGNWTPMRPFWTAGHLINTFILLAFLSLTAWIATGKRWSSFKLPVKFWLLFILGLAGILLVGITGSMAALSSMLFPSASVTEAIARDFSESSHFLLRLRISHPILSIITGAYLVFLAGWLKAKLPGSARVARCSNTLSVLILIQFAFGAATLLTLAPIMMQVGHLLLADAIWISFVLMWASCLADQGELIRISLACEDLEARDLSAGLG